MQVKLFKLLNADCEVQIDNQSVDMINDYGFDKDKNPILRCDDGGDQEWFFVDQDVDFIDGSCTAITSYDPTCNGVFSVYIVFYVKRRLNLMDLV